MTKARRALRVSQQPTLVDVVAVCVAVRVLQCVVQRVLQCVVQCVLQCDEGKTSAVGVAASHVS